MADQRKRSSDLVVIFIDPLYDFLHPEGAFASAYGHDRTITVRGVFPELLELFSACVASDDGVSRVAVTSVYQPNQFRTCPTLCTTSKGCEIVIPGTFDLTITKTTNNLLDCDDPNLLLETIKGRRVLVCGVTAAHCVKRAVESLSSAGRCREVIVARNTVGYTGNQSYKAMDDWKKIYSNVSLVSHWQHVLYPPQHYLYQQRVLQQQQSHTTIVPAVGEGDSFFVENVLDLENLAGGNDDLLLKRVLAEVAWEKMYIRGKAVNRDVALQVIPRPEDGSIPLYRNPGWQSLRGDTPMSPTVNQIRLQLQERFGIFLNHVKIQLYRDGKASIGRHSDKTLDISHGSPIVNISLGCPRVFSLTHKRNGTITNFSMQNNSCFLLGWHTNRTHWHHVDKLKKVKNASQYQQEIDSETSAAAVIDLDGPRISMVFRHIATYQTTTNPCTLSGQGAKVSSNYFSSDSDDTREEDPILHQSFSKENKESDLRWSDLYGHYLNE